MRITTGRSISDRLAYGPLHFYHRSSFAPSLHSQLDVEEEVQRFHAAQQRAISVLGQRYQQAVQEVGLQAASIFSVHGMLLEDESLEESVLSIIRTHHATAEYAVYLTCKQFSHIFAAMDNPYMQARGADIRDISNQLIHLLLGEASPALLGDRPAILVTDELLPSEALSLNRQNLLGVVCHRGNVNSHTAVLLRLWQIPTLTQVPVETGWNGHPALLDGPHNRLYLDPEPSLLNKMGLIVPGEYPSKSYVTL